jgi:hypothetical protein
MKKLFFILVFALGAQFVFAQNPIAKGGAQFNAGVGLSSWGIPLYVGFDYGAGRDITVGGELSFRNYNENWRNRRYNHSVIGIASNANYHFNRILNIPSEWNFYAGLNLGFFIWNSPDGYGGSRTSGLGLGGQVGGRYYFTNRLGINLELGGGNAFSGGKVGISLKI